MWRLTFLAVQGKRMVVCQPILRLSIERAVWFVVSQLFIRDGCGFCANDWEAKAFRNDCLMLPYERKYDMLVAQIMAAPQELLEMITMPTVFGEFQIQLKDFKDVTIEEFANFLFDRKIVNSVHVDAEERVFIYGTQERVVWGEHTAQVSSIGFRDKLAKLKETAIPWED